MVDQVGLKKIRDNWELNQYPDDLKEDYLFLSDWVRELSWKYGDRISIRIIDGQSLQGMYKSIRHGIHRYPTFILNRKRKYTGKDKGQLEALLEEELAEN